MKIYEDPADISSYLLNFRAFLRMEKIMDDDGHIDNMKAFKEALVSTIEKAVVIEDLSKLDEKLKEEQPIFVKIKVFVVFSDDMPVRAFFRKHKARIGPGESLEEYTVHNVDDAVRITGLKDLKPIQEEAMFDSLAAEVAAVKIFDEEPAPLADALRGMIQN